MRKILALVFAFLIPASAIADNIGDFTGLGMSGELADAVDKAYSTNIAASIVPNTTSAINLGSTTKVFNTAFLGGGGLNFQSTYEEAVAGAGTTVADAAALSATKPVHQITGANGTVGWKFVTATPIGSIQILLNTTAGVPKIYGESGSTCNGGAADAACTLVTGIGPHLCWKAAALTYICA